MPCKKASRISISTSSARRWNRSNPGGKKLFPRALAIRNRKVPRRVTKSRS